MGLKLVRIGGPLGSPAYLFLSLISWGNTTPPHPAGDPKGPPNPSSSTLAPTDRPASCLASRLRLMPLQTPGLFIHVHNQAPTIFNGTNRRGV